MKKLMSGIIAGFLFLVVASQVSYAEQCGCAGQMLRGGSQMGMSIGPRMMHQGPEFMGGMPGRGHFLWHKLMRLGLTDKQKDAIKAIRSRVEKETIKKGADLALSRVELREILDKDQVDMNAVEANLKKAESVRTDLRLSHIKAMVEIKTILTPEQRKKLKEDFEAGFMKHEGRCGGRGTGFSPPAPKGEAQHGAEEQ